MAIKTGIGVGEAQVFDTGGIMNTYFKLLQNQQKEKAKYQQELADIMATVKTEGVRDKDKPIIANTYEEIKKLYAEAVNSKSPNQRALNRSLIKEKIASLNEYSARSNQFAKEYKSLAEQMAPNIWKYDPKKVEEFKAMADKSLVDLGDKAYIDPFEYVPKLDDSARDKVQTDIYKQEEKRIGPKDYVKETIAGTGERYVGVANKNRVINDITTKLATSPEYRQLAYSQYVDMNPGSVSPDIEDVIANELKLYEQKFGYKYEGNISRIPKESKGDTVYIGGDAVTKKDFMTEDSYVRNSKGEMVKVARPKLAVRFDKFIGVNPQQFSIPQLSNAFDISSAKWGSYKPQGNVEIVGLGVRPNGQLNVVIQDNKGFEYMIFEGDLPLGIRNNKLYKAARASVYNPNARVNQSNTINNKTEKSNAKNSDPLNIFSTK